MNDQEYMRMALRLAEKGAGWVSPNPLVGAVIVKNGRIIGQGYHERYGELHAERNALASCTEDPRGADMYVTLEPCCHHGKQPPCVDAILEAGIRRVAIGSVDPNPLVCKKGIQILRDHNVLVKENVLREECDRINQVFFHYIQTKRPYVTMKYAMTMDGKIAAYTGASRWITGETARRHVQEQRHRNRGIMVGIGTVRADDPLLTCRMEGGRDPIRIICDSKLCTPLTSQIIQTARDVHVDLPTLMERLGEKQIDSILLEGGGTLNWAALESGIVQKIQTYIAPKLFGGRTAKTPVEGTGFPTPADSVLLKNTTITRIGDDLLIESEVDSHVHRDR